MKNRGVILGQRSTDYIAGVLPYEVRNPSGDWTPYLPSTEKQHFDGGDSMACVSFSANNSIEIQTKFLTSEEVNYSDRFLAKMSGTIHQGNWLWAVADTIRKCGLIKEEDWPALPKFTWESYYSEIPDWLKARALKWLDKWEMKYEFIDGISPSTLIKHLKHAPLQIVVPGHAVVEILQEQDVYKYFDTYEPYIKIRKEMPVQVLKLVLYAKGTTQSMKITKELLPLLYRAVLHREPDTNYWVDHDVDQLLRDTMNQIEWKKLNILITDARNLNG